MFVRHVFLLCVFLRSLYQTEGGPMDSKRLVRGWILAANTKTLFGEII